MKKNQCDQEKLDYWIFKIFAVTMELNCNGKNHKSQIIIFVLDQTDIFHKTEWFSLVPFYMWVTYELIQMSFSAQN